MKVSYLVRKEEKAKRKNIKLRFTGSGFDFVRNTNFKIELINWSSSKQEVKLKSKIQNKSLINSTLKNLSSFVIEQMESNFSKGLEINGRLLEKTINTYFNVSKDAGTEKTVYITSFLLDFLEVEKTRLVNGNLPSKHTLKNSKATFNKLLEYEKFTKTRFKFVSLDLDFYYNFVNWLRDDLEYSNNTIGTFIKRLKYFIRQAYQQDIKVNKAFESNEFKAPSGTTIEVYLNPSEIQKLDNNNNLLGSLAIVRDWFLIGLNTGLRVSDFLRLTQENLKDGFIKVTAQKTKTALTVPILPITEKIIKKYSGFPPKISSQFFNKLVKKVCKESGIIETVQGALKNKENRLVNGFYPKYKLISSHTCRRSFATNLYNSKEFTNATIMHVTGHKKESTFLLYIRVTGQDSAKQIQDYYKAKQTETQAKETGFKPNLKAI